MIRQLLCLMFLLLSCFAFSQAGIQFMGGLSSAQNENLEVTPEGSSHSGYFFGADAALNQGKMFFIIGAQYHKLSFEAQTTKNYFSVENPMNWFKLRFGLGFQLFQISDDIKVKAKTLASINALVSYPENFNPEPYHIYNSSVAAIALGLGLEFKSISFELGYDIGFFNAVNKIENSKFDFLTASLGFKI
ncbi:MAG: hypothetical protein HKO66_05475 [Saprospiraceae bacterium]|nr:hypothetical protein [Bacteroidia bacterium]NNL91659.1 hypothetical protein [Saprospiraceae bacterium]